jgi:glycogen debranching enzyme
MAACTAPRSDTDEPANSHLRLFEALFGRDSLICARILLPHYPGLARQTVLALAALQGCREEVRSEEEPGRIPHEVREPEDPVARSITANAGWAWPYYGSIDATCLWISLVTALFRIDPSFLDTLVYGRGGRRTMLDCLVQAVEWLVRRLDATESGLLESHPRFPGSIENQVWKDSWDAYCHADGTLATPGTIASVEVQGLAHDALLDVALVLTMRAVRAGPSLRPAALRLRADHIRSRILSDFWVEDEAGGFFALGLDRDLHGKPRPLAVRSSNMGHLLLSGVLDSDDTEVVRKRDALLRALLAPDMLCAAGVRTLSSAAARYRPNAYHNGNCWPWDTFMISAGMHRHGFTNIADDLCRRILRGYLATHLFPEFFSGDDDSRPHFGTLIADVVDHNDRRNRICQPPQEVQAWTVAALLAIKRMIGGGRLRSLAPVPKPGDVSRVASDENDE